MEEENEQQEGLPQPTKFPCVASFPNDPHIVYCISETQFIPMNAFPLNGQLAYLMDPNAPICDTLERAFGWHQMQAAIARKMLLDAQKKLIVPSKPALALPRSARNGKG